MNKSKFYKFIPLIILILGLVVFFSFGGQKYLSLEALKNNYQDLLIYTQNHFVISVLAFMLLYIIIVAFSIPGAAAMTLLGGILFGIYLGAIAVIISATIGATLLYLAVKSAIADALIAKAKGSVEKMRAGFEKNAFNYLLVLRLVPIFPFFIINIVAGLLGVKFKDFVLATLLGIIPGSTIYVWVGTGVGYAIKQGNDIDLGIVFEPQFILPILALAVLSLLPTFFKKSKKGINYDKN